ncbi:HAL/PAL/TAL family ammonia-lyase [Methylotenera versatilis]|uniref:tyrosine ammonia-lyase n=1 Tax=Methylotenera versatilis (strain 301) TaxID=666681 RepID=D7DKL1_METV0|nr:aromatic amino acid ammonia-lyase [Methylotenera versatilis]ADI30457.1 Histidine ammonia-lyase [Methylotenera versatilis 301]
MIDNKQFRFDNGFVGIDDVINISESNIVTYLNENDEYLNFIQRGADFILQIVSEGTPVYGINTGYGDSCNVVIPEHLVFKLPRNLYTYHGCGLGQFLSNSQVRAVMVVRLASLCKGFSGIRPLLLRQIIAFLNEGIAPLIPSEGSVGASGDLTPLSYLAAALCGEREVIYKHQRMDAQYALRLSCLAPLQLQPKEALALMNGTSVMTALACEAYTRANYLKELTTRITSMASYALDGNANHFDAFLFTLKPHSGQENIASWIREDLVLPEKSNSGRIQDRYSIRCAPHIIGVLADALPWIKSHIENEINSVNDNPVIDGENQKVMHGGHFYGGHIAFAMDSLKNLIANLADMMDRQMALLVDTRYNNGLPANLSADSGPDAAVSHGLKALQISVSAWTAEALKLTMPASVFSRSTECHNQDKVSMGTIASRDCLRILQLTEQVAAGMLVAVYQGVSLRLQMPQHAPLHPRLHMMIDDLSKILVLVFEDRALQSELEDLLNAIRLRIWPLYSHHK